MNEVSQDEGLHLLSEDTVRLEEYIKGCIPEAVNMVVSAVPVSAIRPKKVELPLLTVEDGMGRIVLPADFLRLVAVRLVGWKRSVSVAYPFGSNEYHIQHNVYTRAGVNKPVCVFAFDSLGGRVLECFPATDGVEFLLYANITTAGAEEISTPSDDLFPAVCYMCASLVYDVFENPNTAERMKTIALGLIPKV